MAERYIPEHRRTQFKAKNTFKPEELRRRREEQQVEIRKAKREENLAKRRGIGAGDRPGASLGAEPDSDDDTVPTESQVCPLWHFPCPFPSLLRSSAMAIHQNSHLELQFSVEIIASPFVPLYLLCAGGVALDQSWSLL